MADETIQLKDATGNIHLFRVKSSDGSKAPYQIATPADDQDPIYDYANQPAAPASVTSGAVASLLTVPAGCKYVEVYASAEILTRDDGDPSATGKGTPVPASIPKIIPVVPGTVLKAIAVSATATVRVTPMKSRA